MNLYKKILDDQKKVFQADSAQDRLFDEVMQSLSGGKKAKEFTSLSEIEKRQQELDEMLYELANRHRKNVGDKSLTAQSYKMPTAYSGSDSESPTDDEQHEKDRKQSVRDKRFKALNKRYEEEPTKRTEQE